MLLVEVRRQVEAAFVSNLYVAYMEGVDNSLHGLRFAPWCGGQREHTEMGVLGHQISDDLRICVVTSAFVSFVYMEICLIRRLEKHRKRDVPMTSSTMS